MGLVLSLHPRAQTQDDFTRAAGCPPEFVLRQALAKEDGALLNHLQECVECNRKFIMFAIDSVCANSAPPLAAALVEASQARAEPHAA